MIPYALFMMKLYYAEKALEIRALDPIPEGISFRVEKSRAKEIEKAIREGNIHRAECSFLDYEKACCREMLLEGGNFELKREEESAEDETGAVYFTMTSSKEEFLVSWHRLLKDYLNYICLKTDNDEISAMEIMTGKELSDKYPEDLKAWHLEIRKKMEDEQTQSQDFSSLKTVQAAICLDSRTLWEKFLELPWEEFLAFYMEENGLTGHPITKLKVTHLYIGSSYCLHLYPEEEIGEIVEKARQLNLVPVAVFSMISEETGKKVKKRLKKVLETGIPEIVAEDLSLPLLLEEVEEDPVKWPVIRRGAMTVRRRKDVRLGMHAMKEEVLKAENNLRTDEAYLNYLKERFHFQGTSLEVCGYPLHVEEKDTALHLPRYQMNTATNCSLYALCKNGDRGAQEKVAVCPMYCENMAMFYPEGTGMIGRGNSLFGVSTGEIGNISLLNQLIEEGVSRLVIRM